MRSLSDYTQEKLADNRDWQGGRVIYTPRHVTLARAAGGMKEGNAIRETLIRKERGERETFTQTGKRECGIARAEKGKTTSRDA